MANDHDLRQSTSFIELLERVRAGEIELNEPVLRRDRWFIPRDESGELHYVRTDILIKDYTRAYTRKFIEITRWDTTISDNDKARLITEMLCERLVRWISEVEADDGSA